MNDYMYRELTQGLISLLEGQIDRIVLYGSTARGEATPESDIDIAIILHSGLSEGQQDRLSDLVVDMNLKYDKVFSVIDIDQETFKKWKTVVPFYRNVEKEGIVLWKAA